jgi:hypothetical protein
MIASLTRSKIVFLAILVIVFYLTFFGILFSYDFIGEEMSFLFQIVVAMMSTGVLAIVTGSMLIFQYRIETRKENATRVFENKIKFYFDTLNQIDSLFGDGGLSPDTSHRLLFLTTKSMLVCSSEAANKFSLLADAIEKKDAVPAKFKDFIYSARKDLDLVDNIDAEASEKFDTILKKLEASVTTETKKLFRSDDEKRRLVKKYDEMRESRKGRPWLKENSLWLSQIDGWRHLLEADKLS